MADVVGIGGRMAAARARKQASQIKAAAMLEISDRSYKNYEAEKRELPLAVAIGFCEAFDVELEWLVYGMHAHAGDKTVKAVSETIEALILEAQARKLVLTPNRAARIGSLIYRNSTQKGMSPKTEAGPIFDIFIDD